MTYALEVEHVNKVYDNFELRDINFKLEKGLILGLIGTNGAGKTTLIQTILGLYKKTGTIKINGLDTNEYERETKDLCGFVLDDNPFLPELNALGNARMLGPYYSHWNERQFLEYCKKFEVNIKKPLSKLSQGTVTKFQLAFALSHNAQLLVFDEPSSGLDPIFRRELLDIMYDVIMDGERSVLFSTHLTNELDHVADHIVMLHNGRQLFSLPKEELLDRYLLVRGSQDEIMKINENAIIGRKYGELYAEALVQTDLCNDLAGLTTMRPTIEDIMVYIVKQ